MYEWLTYSLILLSVVGGIVMFTLFIWNCWHGVTSFAKWLARGKW
jgi:hypothetical protein